jgi:hypothetical protein
VEPFTIIEGPSAWIGSELRKNENQYIYHLTPDDIFELEKAVATVEAAGVRTAEEVC